MTFLIGVLLCLFAPDCLAAPALVAMGMSAGTAATVSTVATIAATAYSVSASIQSGKANEAAAEANAQQAEMNATASRAQAAASAESHGREARKRIGLMEASYAASGVTSEGSPLEILQQSERDAELDRLTILYGGETRALGYQGTASLDRSRGEAAATAGYVRAGSELLSGASRTGSLTRV
jgi:mannitol-specific phosphotransferase system IIBC component